MNPVHTENLTSLALNNFKQAIVKSNFYKKAES